MAIVNIKGTLLDLYRRSTAPLGPRFQVIGERNSGTNYVEALIASNLSIKPCSDYGWKHGFPTMPASSDNVFIVAVSRDAFSWVKSMYVRPYHATPELAALDFPSFIRAEWDTILDKHYSFKLASVDERIGAPLQLDRHPIEGRKLSNIMELRSLKLRSHLSLVNRDVKFRHFRLADILEDPTELIETLAGHNGQKPPSNIQIPQKHFSWHMEGIGKPEKRRQAATFTDADRTFLLESIDLATEQAAGYTY